VRANSAYGSAMTEPKADQLTAAQRAALEAELAELEGPHRQAVVQAIKTAREHGDLSENFEYHAAKNEQGLLEARIRTLRQRLDNAVLVDESALTAGEVGIGSIVEIEDEDGCRMKVEISSVSGTGTASPESPLGRALLGRAEGDAVEIAAPGGSWSALIIAVKQP
jgi:transcription elongation factor GreA